MFPDMGLDELFSHMHHDAGHDAHDHLSEAHDHLAEANHDHGSEESMEALHAADSQESVEVMESLQLPRLVGIGGTAYGLSRALPALSEIGIGSTKIMANVLSAAVGASAVSRVIEQRTVERTRGGIPQRRAPRDDPF